MINKWMNEKRDSGLSHRSVCYLVAILRIALNDAVAAESSTGTRRRAHT